MFLLGFQSVSVSSHYFSQKRKHALHHCCSDLWSVQFIDNTFGTLEHYMLIVLKLHWREPPVSHIKSSQMSWNKKREADNWPGRRGPGTGCNFYPCESIIIISTRVKRRKSDHEVCGTWGVCCQTLEVNKVRHLSFILSCSCHDIQIDVVQCASPSITRWASRALWMSAVPSAIQNSADTVKLVEFS